MVYKFMVQNPYTHRQNTEQRNSTFSAVLHVGSHSEAYNTEQMLTPHCKFKVAPKTGLSRIFYFVVLFVWMFMLHIYALDISLFLYYLAALMSSYFPIAYIVI